MSTYGDFARIDSEIAAGEEQALQDLARLCKIPSVSAKSQDLVPCAELVAELFLQEGLEARLMETNGGPLVVYGEAKAAQPAPTVLFYNHYDVQPAEPFDLWNQDPFELTLRNDCLYARGVGDDKGHIISRLLALRALRRANGGELPFNVKFVAEGEEEIGSSHLGPFVQQNADLLKADACIWEEGGVGEEGRPALYCGMRGIAYFEIESNTISRDAHSGGGGTLFPNAAWRLVWALNTLKGPDERIQLAGHYDRVRQASPRDLELLSELPDIEPFLEKEYGIAPGHFLGGAATTGVELERRAVFEPSMTICGLQSGWQGVGAKTVLPARALAKVDFRLVPDQDPEEVRQALIRHLADQGFPELTVRYLGGQKPARVDPDHPWVRLSAETAEEVYGKRATIAPIVGGSGPMWWFAGFLGLPVTSPGVEYPGTSQHAPNEHIRLKDFRQGTRHLARLLARIREAVPAPG
jgi:acetylornithine deacetylase/succinyl-diaminopimelate desuccinylase-like protein